MNSNQCIQAILDEYYEGNSYEDASYDSEASKASDNVDDRLTSTGSTQANHDLQKSEKNLHTVSPSSNEEKYQPSQQEEHAKSYKTIMSNYNNNIDHIELTKIIGKENLEQHCSNENDNFDNCGLNRRHDTSICSSEVEVKSSQENPWNTFGKGGKRQSISIDINCKNATVLKDTTNANSNVNRKDGSSIDEPFPPSNSNQSAKPKKPFLKKGSRKEPSSLQRVKDDAIKNGMRFKNEIQTEAQNDTISEPKKLEHLERMQQEQIDNLEKRLQRREKAREEIRQNRLESKNKTFACEKKGDRDTTQTTRGTKTNSFQDELSESSSNEDCSDEYSSDEETEDDSSEDEEVILSKEDKTSDANNKRKEQKSLGGKVAKRSSVPQRKKAQSNRRIRKRGRRDEGYESTDFKSAEMEEQWQVIKSMRKRQEAALRSADKEREEARSWANNERENVLKWVEQQRLLIKKDRKRVMNDVMVSQRKKRQEGLEERAAVATANRQKELRNEIETLTAALQKQKIDNDAAKSRSRLNEKRLRDVISERDKKIEILRHDIEKMSMKYAKLEEEKKELSKFKSDQKKKKKKRKKHSEQYQDLEEEKDDSNIPIEIGQDIPATNQDSPKKDVEPFHSSYKNPLEEGCQVSACDKEAIRVISERQDLIKEPTEKWLQKHLDQNINESIDASSYTTPMKGKKYDPEKYSMTPQTSRDNQDLSFQSAHSSFDTNAEGEESTSGRRMITYRNGTQKEILPDGTSIVRFTNGDTKTTYSNIGIVVYYYAEARTSHTSHPDGLEIFEFASGQTERHYPNGRKEVNFPDGTQQVFLPNGDRVNSFADGVNVMESNSGTKIIQQKFSN